MLDDAAGVLAPIGVSSCSVDDAVFAFRGALLAGVTGLVSGTSFLTERSSLTSS